jgi:hypothetical protein
VGASGWKYYVPYQDDLAASLQQLQNAVFSSGEYYWHGDRASERSDMPTTVEELWQDEWVHEAGTHSILDMSRVIAPVGADDRGTVRPLSRR